MENSKFLKILWTINGLILLGLFVVGLVAVVINFFSRSSYNDKDNVIVGKELEEAKKQGLILQGLQVGKPWKIYGTKTYVLPVQIKTYEVPKEKPIDLSFGDRRSKFKLERDGDGSHGNTINILFLDEQLHVTHRLLDRKAFIDDYDIPEEPRYFNSNVHELPSARDSANIIFYTIAFEDSDKNGTIDSHDKSDLYLSDLTGRQLTKVASDIDVLDYNFLSKNEMLISYNKRDSLPDEHKKKYFASYFIKEKKLEQLTSIDKELDSIEEILSK